MVCLISRCHNSVQQHLKLKVASSYFSSSWIFENLHFFLKKRLHNQCRLYIVNYLELQYQYKDLAAYCRYSQLCTNFHTWMALSIYYTLKLKHIKAANIFNWWILNQAMCPELRLNVTISYHKTLKLMMLAYDGLLFEQPQTEALILNL